MGDGQARPGPEPLLSEEALAYQAEMSELNATWQERQQYWTVESARLDALEAAQAERQAARLAQKQRLLEQDRGQALRKSNESPQAAIDTLKGWNSRKTPRSQALHSSTRPGSNPAKTTQEVSTQEHTIVPEEPPAHLGAPGRSAARTSPSDHEFSTIKQQKPLKESGNSSSSSAKPPHASSAGRQPPEWYTKLKVSKKRSADVSGADTLLQRLKDQVTGLKKSGPMAKEMNKLREMLHEAPFLAMGQAGPQLLRNKRMLHNEDGLPQIFDDDYAGTMKGRWPWDVQSDAAELYNRWCARNFDDNMLFGLILAQRGKYAEDDRAADQVDKTFQVSSKYKGNGKLVNGQWWPTLLCALRDGAHGDSQAGISGETGIGAYSCFMSGGKNHVYPDKDKGDVVEYFGQDTTTPGQISRGTSLLMKSKQDHIPVRFIRSSKAASHSQYAPQLGFRYDGLYDVTSYELVDKIKERYKFTLVRVAGQGPIRGGDGPEARPTQQEVERFQQDKRFRGFSKAE